MVFTVDEKNGTFQITGQLSALTPSASGKTLVVASTRGNLKTNAKVNGQFVTLGLNAYIPNPAAPAKPA